MYKGNWRNGIPFRQSDDSWKFENGMLTVDGCFSRHHHSREDEYQDAFKHTSLAMRKYVRTDGTTKYDDPYRDMYDTFKYFERMYQFKEIFDGVVVGQLSDNIGQS